MRDSRKALFKLINCADSGGRAAQEILEALKAGKREWGRTAKHLPNRN